MVPTSLLFLQFCEDLTDLTMPRKPSYTQLKAKKKWLLHTSSSRRKFNSKTRLTSQKPRRNSWPSSVGNEHISSSQKRTIFRSLFQISGLLQSSKDSEEVFKVSDFDKNSKWLIQRSMGAVLLPINMALYSALMNGTQFFRYYFEAMRKAIAMASESLNSGIKNGFKSVGTYQRVCTNLKNSNVKKSMKHNSDSV